MASRTDYDPTGGNDGADKSGVTNKASADVENHVTLYVSLPAGDTGAYLKLGYSMMEVISKVNLGTGSDYGNDDVGGYHGSVGYQHDLDAAYSPSSLRTRTPRFLASETESFPRRRFFDPPITRQCPPSSAQRSTF